jgi:hypothetical protein
MKKGLWRVSWVVEMRRCQEAARHVGELLKEK